MGFRIHVAVSTRDTQLRGDGWRGLRNSGPLRRVSAGAFDAVEGRVGQLRASLEWSSAWDLGFIIWGLGLRV